MKNAGADGYIYKSTDARLMVSSIIAILNGENVFLKNRSLDRTANDSPNMGNILRLTDREKQIISLIKNGMTSKTIALKLHISEYTVETHRKNISKKLEIKSIPELISFANSNGL